MTLKYESELLFDLMKRDGDNAPSDVLPYESELKEKYLNQVLGAYPKLQDYRAEWLNYNLYFQIPSDFPVESVTNVTSASFYNVVPDAYERAILKGKSATIDGTLQSVKSPVLTTTGKNLFNEDMLTSNFTKNEKGGYIVNGISNASGATFAIVNIDTTKIYTITVSCTSDTWCTLLVKYKNGETTTKPIANKTMSVTTRYSDKYEVEYILAYGGSRSYVYNIQIEDGSTTTSYEPYKSNILTTPEDLELRGIGDVRDTLDCLTGKLTKRIGEIVLDGSENWEEYTHYGIDGYTAFITTIPSLNNLYHATDKIFISADFPVGAWIDYRTNLIPELVWNHDPNKIGIRVKSEKASTVNEIKEFLSTNNIRINYVLATESIKTVDLTVTDHDGNTESFIRPIEGTMHVNTSSQTLPPLLDMSVPVEATTQNLMSFANIEVEE